MAKSGTRSKYEIGSVLAIPLPDGRFAFAKVHKDFELGIYDFLAEEIRPLEDVTKHRIAFFQAATDAPIKSGAWPIIGVEPFPDEAHAWAPPKAVGVMPGLRINPGVLQILEKGALRRATPAEVAGLDMASFCQQPELLVNVVVDRLINGRNDRYRVQ